MRAIVLHQYPSDAASDDLARMFPTHLVDVERTIYEFVDAAARQNLPSGLPALSFYADRERAAQEGRRVDVVRGWPVYPGVVPAIGVAAGTETEDQQHESLAGGFAGTVYAHDGVEFPADGSGLSLAYRTELPRMGYIDLTGPPIAAADYYAEPLYNPIVVELIHENRDERDRLHNELRRILRPMRRELLASSSLIRFVRVDAEKGETNAGPPNADEPLLIYTSVFTVHVYHEMLEARDVVGRTGIVARIDVSVSAADTGA